MHICWDHSPFLAKVRINDILILLLLIDSLMAYSMEVYYWFVLIGEVAVHDCVAVLLVRWPLILGQLLLKLVLLLRVMVENHVFGEADIWWFLILLCHTCCHLFGQVDARKRSCGRRAPLLVIVLGVLLECEHLFSPLSTCLDWFLPLTALLRLHWVSTFRVLPVQRQLRLLFHLLKQYGVALLADHFIEVVRQLWHVFFLVEARGAGRGHINSSRSPENICSLVEILLFAKALALTLVF